MSYYLFKCRKCRNLLFTTDYIITSRGQSFQNLSTENDHIVTGSADANDVQQLSPLERLTTKIKEEDACENNLWFLDFECSPNWVLSILEQNSYLKGKLCCPRCNGRIGSFDFLSSTQCVCRKHIIPSIHVSKSRVDLCCPSSAVPSSGSPQHCTCRSPPTLPSVDSTEATQDSISLSSVESGYESGRSPAASNENQMSESINTETTASAEADSISADASEETPGGNDEDLISNDDNRFSVLEHEELASESWDNMNPSSEFPDYKTEFENPDAESLTCSVCLELYYQPHKCEPCKHVYCGPCLRRLKASAPFNTKCPLCREIIWKCLPDDNLNSAVQSGFPQEYKARKQIEKRLKAQLPPLPGCATGPLRFLTSTARRYRNRQPPMLAMWGGACFVILLMILCFTIFAMTVGFFLWYLLEVAMDIVIDVFMEMNNFFDRAWQALIILCIEGQVPEQVNTMLAGSVRKMFASFGKLANRTKTFLNDGEFYDYGTYDVGVMRDHVANMRDHVANETSQLLSRMAQASVANYLLAAVLMTYMVYRLARHMQRLPA